MPKILIDTDPGIDDALAITMALNAPDWDVVAITTVNGNVAQYPCAINAGRILKLNGFPAPPAANSIPVYQGCSRCLFGEVVQACSVHGSDGLGGVDWIEYEGGAYSEERLLEEGYITRGDPVTRSAPIMMSQLATEHAGELTVVCLGPLTNLALALRLDPALPRKVARLVVMGAAWKGQGNSSNSAEFNVHADPEAAKMVFEAFRDILLVPWEACVDASVDVPVIQQWLTTSSPRAEFFSKVLPFFIEFLHSRKWSFLCCDGLAMLCLIRPGFVQRSTRHTLDVETQGLARGLTIVDHLGIWNRPANVEIVEDVDIPAFREELRRAMTGVDKE
eukprot:gnl/Trimastix_PCT/458.p1 GENE.gnl/Trimastix_PCT/458~~gnl/Trimastix_PCT/458.p1  ORF type:complete len:334 (-),score=79.23 gnl/Trimastix_PCT/458:9-1010(-)